MGKVVLRNVEKDYAGAKVIHGIDLEVADGEFVVFVGPSGCGKSSMLRMIAGLEEISAGELYIGNQLANELPPTERGAAMVFQNYALYPHMSVFDNMGFALKIAGQSKAEINTAVQRAAKILRIEHLLQRKPKALSGGERQRVAIGRAIVRKPKVFLFDEPLSNLDAALRVQMRLELTRLHRELGSTMIYVTHDQVEAMTMGERIVVFNQGKIEQVGTPLELYRKPVNRFVASFLGSPKMNFIPCRAYGSAVRGFGLGMGGANQIRVPSQQINLSNGQELQLGVRPEHLQLVAVEEGIPATVDLLEHLGDAAIVYLKIAGVEHAISCKLPANTPALAAGEVVGVLPISEHCVLFDTAGQAIH